MVALSAATLADSRLAYGAAMTLAVAGTLLADNGFTLKFKVDMLEPEHEQKAEVPKPATSRANLTDGGLWA